MVSSLLVFQYEFYMLRWLISYCVVVILLVYILQNNYLKKVTVTVEDLLPQNMPELTKICQLVQKLLGNSGR